MPRLTLDVTGPADRLLLAGLTRLRPVLEELRDGTLLIGGLAVTAWLHDSPLDFPVRATRDVDLGIDRAALRLTSRSQRVRPLLDLHDFRQRPGDEPFRFTLTTDAGEFLLDLLLPRGASRDQPPLIEANLDSVAAPGLAYALHRGPDRLHLTLTAGDTDHDFNLGIATLDAMLVMKATLTADSARIQTDRRITDTADTVMLAAACTHEPSVLTALRNNRVRREPSRALNWLAHAFSDERAIAARRIEQHFETTDEARQVPRNAHALVRNPSEQPPGKRRLLIGRTNGGRTLTLVIERTIDPTTWLIVTGWDSSARERRLV